MKPCPFCGVSLTAALVDSIIDPKQDESCPRHVEPKPSRIQTDAEAASKRLASLMMLGSLVSA